MAPHFPSHSRTLTRRRADFQTRGQRLGLRWQRHRFSIALPSPSSLWARNRHRFESAPTRPPRSCHLPSPSHLPPSDFGAPVPNGFSWQSDFGHGRLSVQARQSNIGHDHLNAGKALSRFGHDLPTVWKALSIFRHDHPNVPAWQLNFRQGLLKVCPWLSHIGQGCLNAFPALSDFQVSLPEQIPPVAFFDRRRRGTGRACGIADRRFLMFSHAYQVLIP